MVELCYIDPGAPYEPQRSFADSRQSGISGTEAKGGKS